MNHYAGIGSRDTPQHILNMMQRLGFHMANLGWTLRSGGAIGADTAFEIGCNLVGGSKEIFLSKDATPDAIELALKYHPNPKALKQKGDYVLGLMGRNMQIISGTMLDKDVEFVVSWTRDGKDSGGTGHTMRYCWDKGIRVYNLFDNFDLQTLKECNLFV
jgi:hypothetical protein